MKITVTNESLDFVWLKISFVLSNRRTRFGKGEVQGYRRRSRRCLHRAHSQRISFQWNVDVSPNSQLGGAPIQHWCQHIRPATKAHDFSLTNGNAIINFLLKIFI